MPLRNYNTTIRLLCNKRKMTTGSGRKCFQNGGSMGCTVRVTLSLPSKPILLNIGNKRIK